MTFSHLRIASGTLRFALERCVRLSEDLGLGESPGLGLGVGRKMCFVMHVCRCFLPVRLFDLPQFGFCICVSRCLALFRCFSEKDLVLFRFDFKFPV